MKGRVDKEEETAWSSSRELQQTTMGSHGRRPSTPSNSTTRPVHLRGKARRASGAFYEDMVQFTEQFVKDATPKEELTVEDRNLLSIGYKNVIGFQSAAVVDREKKALGLV
ncbi:14-3-3 domain protein [Raphanus sativus]|nr:14-3-3 domain protein [Raphanus sativus]